MRRASIGLAIAATCCVFLGCLHTPMAWSPDGSWLAYTIEVRPSDRIIAPGWIFDTNPPSPRPVLAPASRRQIWATRAATNVSVLLEDSPGPLTSPGWSPDGHALAFGRVVTDVDRSSRFEVVIMEGLDRRRVVSSRPLAPLGAEAVRLESQAIAWSPDGRYLAVPELQPPGLKVIRADDGRVVNSIADAFLPSWAPVGGRLAFYIRANGQSLQIIDSAAGRPRHLIDVGQASQAPIWGRDGESIALIARRPNVKLGDVRTDLIELVRVQLDTAAIENIRSVSADAVPKQDRPIEGTSIAFDRDGENIFCSAPVEGRLNQLTWYRPRENAIFKKFAIVDPAIAMGSLAFSADGRTLAARVAGDERLMAPVLCEPEQGGARARTRLIAPDDPARLEWVVTLVRTAATLLADLRSEEAGPRGKGRVPATGRPTILPVLDELQANPEVANRLRQLGRLGRPLCDRPVGSPDLDPIVAHVFAEARLFFDYLGEDHPAALRDLEALESVVATPEQRAALLTVRAQVLLNQGHDAAARRVVDFIGRIEPAGGRRIEPIGDGYRLAPASVDTRGWIAYLAGCATSPPGPVGERPTDEPNENASSRRDLPFSRQGDPFRAAPAPPRGDDRQQPSLRRVGPSSKLPR